MFFDVLVSWVRVTADQPSFRGGCCEGLSEIASVCFELTVMDFMLHSDYSAWAGGGLDCRSARLAVGWAIAENAELFLLNLPVRHLFEARVYNDLQVQ